MQIREMVLSNFRLFMYDQELRFDSAEKRPLTVVRAENRIGKTTLLTALQWCLYGDAVLADARQVLSGGDLLVSSDALRIAAPGDVIKTQVLVRFEQEGREYIARRVRQTRRGDSEIDSVATGEDSFTVLREDATGTREMPNPRMLIEQALPENVRELFLFDGDRINRFMQPDHQEAVQKAVADMLEFELFDEAQKHLKALLADYGAQLRGAASGEAKQLRDERDRVERELGKIREELSRLEKERQAEEIIEEQLTSELAGAPGDTGKIQQQINELKEQIRRLDASAKSLGEDLGRQLGRGDYFTSTAVVDKARDLLLVKKKAGEIPKRIGEDLIRERLELGVCICGRPLEPGDPAHTCLIDQLSQQKDRAAFDEMATEVLYYLGGFSRRDEADLHNRLDEVLSRRAGYQQTIVALDKQVRDLELQLGKIDVDSVEKTREALADTRKRMRSAIMSISEYKQQENERERQSGDITKRLRQAEKRDERNRTLLKRERLVEECLKALTLTYHNVREIERAKISERTQENFFRMNLRKGEFESVEITPSFRLQVIASGGHVANPVLSGAQRRALSLAFLFALMQVSERDAPVVVDTPLGMTSGPMRRSITQTMVDQANQLVLLLTRSEILEVEDILQASASRQMTLTCSRDYPTELVNPPRLEGGYTEVCDCGITEHCSVCERIPASKVTVSSLEDVQGGQE